MERIVSGIDIDKIVITIIHKYLYLLISTFNVIKPQIYAHYPIHIPVLIHLKITTLLLKKYFRSGVNG